MGRDVRRIRTGEGAEQSDVPSGPAPEGWETSAPRAEGSFVSPMEMSPDAETSLSIQ